MTDRRTNHRLIELLNGDWEGLDHCTRRAILLVADEIDAIHSEIRDSRQQWVHVKRSVYSLMVSVVGSAIVIAWFGR